MTTTTVYYDTQPTKYEILERLLKAEHITFKEMITLMDKDIQVGSGYIPPYPLNPPYFYSNPDDVGPLVYTSPNTVPCVTNR